MAKMLAGKCFCSAVHYTVAAVAATFRLSTASAYHLVAALSYSLGGVAFA